MLKLLTRGERVIKFIEAYCIVPEGDKVGKPIRLLPFQKKFILEIYDNKRGTSRAYLSIARKNGKSALIAALVLAHVVGPEARRNSQIISGARSRDQAALIYKLAEKMILQSPELSKISRCVPSFKMIHGLSMNVEYRAISAEAKTAHGLSPVLAILDEVGQVSGPTDSFVEAIVTSQGAYEDALLIAISTQAANDADMFSQWLDQAANQEHTVSHVYTAPEECDLLDKEGWAAANPALGKFRSEKELADFAQRAVDLPGDENTFRWLYLNQRIAGNAPFISKTVWQRCGSEVADSFEGIPVYAGLDLSTVKDLTALVLVAEIDGLWHVKPTFWLPAEGLHAKSQADRVPYDVWAKQGFLQTTPGHSIDYEYLAAALYDAHERYDIRKIAFDRWNFNQLVPWLLRVGFTETDIETKFEQFGQGFKAMSPALRSLEGFILNGKIAHGNHPVLTMCAGNATTLADAQGNRMLSKSKSHGRIDGMVALTMAMAVAGSHIDAGPSVYETRGLLELDVA